MRTRRVVVALALIVAAAGALYAKNKEKWLDEAFTKWNAQQVRTILDKSPWSQAKGYRGQSSGQHGSSRNMGAAGGQENSAVMGGGVGSVSAASSGGAQRSPQSGPPTAGETAGTDVPNYEFKAAFFSSLPVREAYVRLFQLENNYESMPDAKKQEFDQKMDGLLHADVSQEVVINLVYHTNDPNAQRDMDQWFNTQTTDTLNQNAYLFTNAGQITLSKYLPPSQTQGFGARFIFPRLFKGEPIVPATGGKLRFQLSYQPQIGQTMYIDFKPEDMIYQGQLSY